MSGTLSLFGHSSRYRVCWLTLNRACNLRCQWCYAKQTGYKKDDDIPFVTAKKIIDICSELCVSHITLIGGEPTLYPHLFETIEYAKNRKIRCGIITNGILLSNDDFRNKLISQGVNAFSISLKGEDRQTFKSISGFDEFEKVKLGIQKSIHDGVIVSVSMVLTPDNIFSYISGIETMIRLGVQKVHLSFCYEVNTNATYDDYFLKNNPTQLIHDFMAGYDRLDLVTNHKFDLFCGYPLCLWDANDLAKLIQKGQLTTVCQLLDHSGLLFDSKGNLIPCNALPMIKLGTLGEDFFDAKTLLDYIETDDVVNAYQRLRGLPSKKCTSCPLIGRCGGGCVCQWTNYGFEELMRQKEEKI